MRLALTAMTLVALAGCQKQPPQAPASSAQPAEVKPIEGFGNLKLGMSYDAAMMAVPDASWNSASLKDCDDVALKGCLVSQYGEGVYYTRLDGIPFKLQLKFDSHATLVAIQLFYERRGFGDDASPISRSECITLLGRTLDHVNGNISHLMMDKAHQSLPKEKLATSPKGFRFYISDDDPSSYVTDFTRTNFGTDAAPIDDSKHRPSVMVLSTYILKTCRIDIDFDAAGQ